jgi:thiamine biosynthesis lipoprotein
MTIIIILLSSCSSNNKYSYIANEGTIYGTIYHIKYESPRAKNLHESITEEMKRFDNSLSTFNPNSTISRINRNDENVEVDEFFKKCFLAAKEVSDKTDGAFDMTVAPLVNAWGFGFKHKEKITPALIDSLLQSVNYKEIELIDGKIIKENPNTMLDASAIAKGLSVDVVAEFLEKKGCKNYMVEIGGEVVAKGINSKGRIWRIGINKPQEDAFFAEQDLQAIVDLKDKALATSGNYRNFYVEGGKKYAHTIDPKSGYPVQHSLLSATVLADDCMIADAYATAFMVLGIEKAMVIAESINQLEAYFIYADDSGNNQVSYTSGFKPYISDN